MVALLSCVSIGVAVEVAGLPTCSPAVVPVSSVCTGMCGTAWGGSFLDQALAVAMAPNGDVVVVGVSHSFGIANPPPAVVSDAAMTQDVLVVRLNGTTGGLLWARDWGGGRQEYGYGVAVAPSGDVVVVGYALSFGGYDLLALRLDGTNGSVVWARTFGGAGFDQANAVALAANGDVVIAGYTNSSGAGLNDVLVLRVGFINGTMIWSRTWGGANNDVAAAVALTDNGIVVTGSTRSFGAGSFDVIVLHLDATTGSVVWSRTYGGVGDDKGTGIAVGPTGIVYVAGSTSPTGSIGAVHQDILVLQLDGANGSGLFARCWGGTSSDQGTSVAVAASGDVAVAGFTYSAGAGFNDVVVLKVDTNGNLVWATVWGGTGYEYGFGVAVTTRGMVVVGSSSSISQNDDMVVLPLVDGGSSVTLPLGGSKMKTTTPAGSMFSCFNFSFNFSILNATTVPAVGNMTSPTSFDAPMTGAVLTNSEVAGNGTTYAFSLRTNPAVSLVRTLYGQVKRSKQRCTAFGHWHNKTAWKSIVAIVCAPPSPNAPDRASECRVRGPHRPDHSWDPFLTALLSEHVSHALASHRLSSQQQVQPHCFPVPTLAS